MKMNNCWTGKTIFFLLLLCAIQSASATAGERRPFDLSKVPMDDGWEDTGIMAAHIAPCGENMLYMGLDTVKDGKGNVAAWKIVVRDIETGSTRSAEIAKDGDDRLLGCTPDSRYLFFNEQGRHTPHTLSIYDTATMSIVKTITHNLLLAYYPQYLSPNGKYLIWDSAMTITLPDGRSVKTLPVFSDPRKEVSDAAWSGDGNTFYLLTMRGDAQAIVIREAGTDKRREMELAFPGKDQVGMKLLVHPETGMVYIQAGYEGYDWPEDVRFLYMLNPAKIPDRGRSVKAAPALLGDMFAGMTFGPDDTIIFSLVPKSDVEVSSFPPEYSGLFLTDLQGKVAGRITNRNDLDPAFIQKKKLLIFQREIKIPDYGWVWKYVVFRKKSATTPSPMSAK